jgi:hypothetical protein
MIENRRCITIVLDSQEYVRNFVESGALVGLSNKFKIKLLAPHRLKLPDNSTDNFEIVWFDELPRNRYALYRVLNDISTWRYRSRSRTFSYRHKRFYPSLGFSFNKLFYKLIPNKSRLTEIPTSEIDGEIPRRIHFYLRNLYSMFKGYGIKFLSQSPLFEILLLASGLNKVKNKYLYNALQKAQPSIILLPTSGVSNLYYEVINIAISLKIPSYFIIDNWDNLSSKALYLKLPDFMGVWGQQTKQHAVTIQGMRKEQIYLLGSARFCIYEKYKTRVSEKSERKFILFLGSFLYFNELRALKILNEEITQNPNIYGDTYILYRPHPLGNNISKVNFEPLNRVKLDPDLVNVVSGNPKTDLGQHNLLHYIELFLSAQFVVGGLTSMLLESGLNQRKYVAIAYEEAETLTSPSTVLTEYLHLQGIESLDHLIICRDEDLLPKLFRACFLSPTLQEVEITNSKLQFFVEHGVEGFAQRLNNSISQILASVK